MKTMETLRKTQKKYGSRALILAIAAAALCFLLGFKPIGKGFILGSLFSVINFTLMGETMPMRMGLSRKKVTAIAFLMILLRYGLMAVPLALAIRMDQFHLAGVITGLFSVQLVIMTDHIWHIRLTKTRNKQTL